MAHHFNYRSLAWGSHDTVPVPDSKKTTHVDENSARFSIWTPFEKGVAAVAGGYYSASYIPDEHGILPIHGYASPKSIY